MLRAILIGCHNGWRCKESEKLKIRKQTVHKAKFYKLLMTYEHMAYESGRLRYVFQAEV